MVYTQKNKEYLHEDTDLATFVTLFSFKKLPCISSDLCSNKYPQSCSRTPQASHTASNTVHKAGESIEEIILHERDPCKG